MPLPKRSVLRTVPWRWREVLLGFCPLLLPRASALLISPEAAAAAPEWLWLPLTLLLMAWMIGYPLAIAGRHQVKWPPPPRPRRVLVEAGLALLMIPLIMLALSGAFAILIYFFGQRAMPGSPLEGIARSRSRWETWALVFLAIAVAPLAEELFFRGMLYNALRKRLRVSTAALLQAAAFGLGHPFGWAETTAVALVGLGFGLVYEWRRTLLAPMLVHAMWNGLSIAVLMLVIARDDSGPRLGIGGDAVEGGCRVTLVVPDSPAARAGLQVGDTINALDAQPVGSIQDVARIVRGKNVGDQVIVHFLRAGKSHQVEATLERLEP